MRRLGVVGAILAFALAGTACRPVKPPPARPPVAIFPNDALTVADPAQATGRRLSLSPPADCATSKSECDEVALLNGLDGFDLDPTVTLTFDRPIDVTRVTDASVFVEPTAGGTPIGLNRLVWDASTNTLLGHPRQQLAAATPYRLTVTADVNGQTGTATFTTMSATTQLRQMREQLDDGSAYTAAGITDRVLQFDADSASNRAVYGGTAIGGSLAPGSAGTRTNDVGSGNTTTEEVFSSLLPGLAEFVGFGRVEAPSWLDADRRIPHTPTGAGAPAVQGKETVGFVVVTPQPSPTCVKPASGWPVAIFGPGFTRSKYDVLLASDELLRRCRATIAIDPVGHAYGPGSEITLNLLVPPGQVDVTAHGRGSDRDGDGDIEGDEGVGTLGQPNQYAAIALRDGLRQTVADNMTLVRALELGLDVDGLGGGDLSTTDIKYFGQSFGGIYGTMLVATDTKLGVGALNVPGGPILDIARLSPAFRGRVGTELMNREPPAFNGDPTDPASFEESQPLYLDPPETNPAAGAVAIQQIGARVNWLNRSGSPEAFAPLLAGVDDVLYQFAYGDQTVSNPTNATLMRAGGLQGVTTLYRNDQTPTAPCNPHGFLLDPRISGRQHAQIQVATFLSGGGIVDPDGAATVFEVPITDPSSIETLNFSPLACPFDEIGVP